jgi:hypothetical protein
MLRAAIWSVILKVTFAQTNPKLPKEMVGLPPSDGNRHTGVKRRKANRRNHDLTCGLSDLAL